MTRLRCLWAVGLLVATLGGTLHAQTQAPIWPREPENASAPRPAAPPAEWLGLVGEYESAPGPRVAGGAGFVVLRGGWRGGVWGGGGGRCGGWGARSKPRPRRGGRRFTST